MSMTAKMSDRGDNMTEANLQVDGPRGRASPKGSGLVEMEEEDSSPHNLLMWSPVQRPPTGHLNTKLLFINTSDFNR